MSEAAKESAKTPKRSKRKPVMEPLGWDEIVSQPGMGGYLSFLNGPVPLPHLQRDAVTSAPATGTPTGLAIAPGVETSEANPRATSHQPPATPVPTPVVVPITDTRSPADIATAPGLATPETNPLATSHQPPATPVPSPVVVPITDTRSPADPITAPGLVTLETSPPATSHQPPATPVPSPVVVPVTDTRSSADPITAPGLITPETNPPVTSHQPPATPSVITIWPDGFQPPPHRIRIRKCFSAQDGHSLGEEVLYQALWKAAAPESAHSRTIVIGWRGMSQLCRMTPKNCKINTQRLIRKLALEVLSPYNTPESIGTTYRVHSPESILARRGRAGMEWVIRSKGVEFVDPRTGLPHSAHLSGYVPD